MPPTPAQQARAARIATQIAGLTRAGFILPGTLTERMTRCGYARCRCRADPLRLHALPPVDPQINGKPSPGSSPTTSSPTTSPGSTTSAASATSSPKLETLSQENADNDPAGNTNHQDHVSAGRLACGPNSHQNAKAQLTPKREDLTQVEPSWFCLSVFDIASGYGAPIWSGDSAVPLPLAFLATTRTR